MHAIRIIALTKKGGDFTAILVEKTEDNFVALKDNLSEAELPIPIHLPESVGEVKRGACNIIHADFNEVSKEMSTWGSGFYTLAFVDPYGPAMGLRNLRPIVSMKQSDCIILFPSSDIVRKGGSVRKDTRTSNDSGNITRINNVFDSEAWQSIIHDSKLGPEDRESAFVQLYDDRLREIHTGLTVKTIPLRFSSTDRTGYYLFLTTRDANGALKMNEVLRKAEFREHYALWADYLERNRQASELAGELSLGLDDVPQIPVLAPPEKADPQQVADRIVINCGSGEFTVKQILGRMANDPFTEAEVKSGLTALKKDGRITGTWKRVADLVQISA